MRIFSTLKGRVLNIGALMAEKELTQRQKLILALIVREHIESAQPVGSKRLVRKYNLDISSATVRNEMSALTELGYLHQPYTSAGRVPTEQGYRYFVHQLMRRHALPAETQRTITHQFYQTGGDVDEWMRLAASILAQQSQAASLVTAPHPAEARFKHIELIATRGRQVLMVLVLVGGQVRQQMLTLAEPASQPRLSAAANHLNALCRGLDTEGVAARAAQCETLEQDIIRLTVEEMRRASGSIADDLYHDGLSNMLAEPEFSESEAARGALRLFEERPMMEDLLTQAMSATTVGGVQVLIGGENTRRELRNCSVVLARYGAPGVITGMLGVLGPIRMPYGRTISTVRFVAGLLSDMVTERLVE
ncbi:MAG TPA: heat-inducible transcription repressor HrcA [Chloroflexi bacterium]|nr:heat-inducible transcription repressor HrcA [Chloroflexota bacterium]